MSNPAFATIAARSSDLDTFVCLGLDPRRDRVGESADALRSWSRRRLETCAPFVCAVKLNSAFFEVYGPTGIEILGELIAAAGDLPVILDAKRGDIGSTAEAYAVACHQLGATLVTLHPWLGRDGVEPFVRRPEHGAFVLCHTSNPSAGELQNLVAAGRPLDEHVAALAPTWSAHPNIGLVVGATAPDALARIRACAPEAWILAPGVGAQGGDPERVVAAGMSRHGGLIVPASRSIADADDPGRAATALRDALRRARDAASRRPRRTTTTGTSRTLDAGEPGIRTHVALELFDTGCIRFGDFELKSGARSPIYIDLRLLAGFPCLLRDVGRVLSDVIEPLSYDRLAPLPYAALPIGTALSLERREPMLYPRREVKNYGTSAAIEGVWQVGETALIVDDLASTGGSKLDAAARLRGAGLIVEDAAILVDRSVFGGRASTAAADLAEAGIALHAAYTLDALLETWVAHGRLSATRCDEVVRLLEGAA